MRDAAIPVMATTARVMLDMDNAQESQTQGARDLPCHAHRLEALGGNPGLCGRRADLRWLMLGWQADSVTGPAATQIAGFGRAVLVLTTGFPALARAKTDGQWGWHREKVGLRREKQGSGSQPGLVVGDTYQGRVRAAAAVRAI